MFQRSEETQWASKGASFVEFEADAGLPDSSMNEIARSPEDF